MAVSISYNSQSLSPQLGKVRFSEAYDRVTFSGQFAVAPGSLGGVLDALNKWDKALNITSAGFTRNYSISTNAVAIRTVAEKVGSALDSTGNFRVAFTAIVERRADASGDNGWREWSATCAETEQGVKVLTVSALVTADSGGQALANAEADIDTQAAGFMSLFSLTAAELEEPTTTLQDLDRHNNIVRITKTWAELFEAVNQATDGDTESRNANLVFTRWEIEEQVQEERGSAIDVPVRFYNLRWGCLFKKGFSLDSATIEGALLAIVVKRLLSQFGEVSDPVLVGSSAIRISSTLNSASASWTFRVAGAGLLFHSEVLELDMALTQFVKVHDGEDFTGEIVSAGAQGVIVQNVTVIEQDAPPGIPAAPLLAGFGEGLQLVLAHVNVQRASQTAGRTVGLAASSARSALDNSAVFRLTWHLRKQPQNSPLANRVTGVRGQITPRDLLLIEG